MLATKGWTELDSSLDGITVFAPAAEVADEGPASVLCRGCGATAAFDPGVGGLSCRFCGWSQASEGGEAGKAGRFTDAALEAGDQGFGVDRPELSCDQCGAHISVDRGALTASCPCCASNQVHIREHAEAPGHRPSGVVAFSKRPSEVRPEVTAWLADGFWQPRDLSDLARVDSLSGTYLPYWMFQAGVRCKWEAEVGKATTTRYYDSESRSYKTRTTIDWEWKSGSISRFIEEVLVAGATHVPETLQERVKPFPIDQLVAYDPALLAGWNAFAYDRGLPDAWTEGRHVIRTMAKSACEASTGSSHVRNFSMTAGLDDEAWQLILLPVYITAYTYGGKTFHVMVNGATGEVVGQKPVQWWKFYLASCFAFSFPLGTFMIGIPMLFFAGIGLAFMILAGILLIFSLVCVGLMYQSISEEAGGAT